jgi:O-acetyl-ADP-ribose deacetylase (regulator of RNase III)
MQYGVALYSSPVFLLVSIGLFWWGTHPQSIGRRNGVLVLASLCAALAATFAVFSLFPSSRVDGSLLGMTVGGAGGFVLLVWILAVRFLRLTERIDQVESKLRDRDREVGELRQQLKELSHKQDPRPLERTQTYLFRLSVSERRADRRLGIVTGDIRRVRVADVWVNSENTDMRMARTQESAISGLIRYESARRDGTGHIIEDIIADELERQIADRRPVPAGTVVMTSAGELTRWGVRGVAHVASVQGEPGAGFQPVREVGRCVFNVLEAIDAASIGSGLVVLFPLLGAGHGGGPVQQIADAMVSAAVQYLSRTDESTIGTVLLLAYTDQELTACRAVLDAIPGLSDLTIDR